MKRILFALLLLVPWVAAAQPAMYLKGITQSVSVQPAVTAATTNYDAGDCVGGKMTVTSAFNASPGSGVLQSVIMADEGAEGKNIDVVIFATDPSGSTFTNNSPCAIADGDLAKVAGVVHLTDHVSFATEGVAQSLNNSIPIDAGAATFYAVAIARESTYYYDATDALTFTFIVWRD